MSSPSPDTETRQWVQQLFGKADDADDTRTEVNMVPTEGGNLAVALTARQSLREFTARVFHRADESGHLGDATDLDALGGQS
jgi:hypothetical protein